MSNDTLMKRYVLSNVFIGFILLIMIFVYQGRFVGDQFVEVEQGVFSVTLASFFEDVTIFHTPLVAFLVVLAFQVFIYVMIGRQFNSEKEALNNVSLYNLLFSVVLLGGQLLFMVFLPDVISGTVRDLVLFTEFPSGGGAITNTINITYLIGFLYMMYNLVVLTLIREPREKNTVDQVLEEENLLREFLKD